MKIKYEPSEKAEITSDIAHEVLEFNRPAIIEALTGKSTTDYFKISLKKKAKEGR